MKRFLLRLAGVLASAATFGLAFPPLRLRPLAFVALVPLLLALRGTTPARAAGLAALWGVAAAWSVGSWMPEGAEVYFGQPRWVGFAVFLTVAASMACPYYAAFGWIYTRLPRRLGAGALPLVTAAAWVAAELGRGRLFTGSAFFIGNPWGLIGYSQVGADALVQIASLTGVYGISFAIVAANAGIAEGILRIRGGGRTDASAVTRLMAASALPLAAILAFGAATLPEDVPTPDAVPVAVVQGNVTIGARWRSEFYGRNFEIYQQLTREALAGGPADLVFWPEGALTFFLAQERPYQRALSRLAGDSGAELLVGGPHVGGAGADDFLNSIFLVTPSEGLRARYDKEHLVPFAEYVPFGGLDLIRRRFDKVRTFRPGGGAAPLPTRVGPAGVLVCNEAMLPEVAGRRVARGAVFLVNPSNDTWIPSAEFAEQLFDVVALRAVEQRRWLVRASTSGPSALVDPWGRVTVRTAPFTRDTLRGHIVPRERRSVYGRVGDLFALACVAVALWAVLATRGGGREMARSHARVPSGYADPVPGATDAER